MRLLLLLLPAVLAFSGDLQDDLKSRRARLMDRLGPRVMFVARSAPARTYSLDVDHEYRQDSNFYYLTGIDQEDCALVLMPGNTLRQAILFVTPRNASREHWTGRRLSTEQAKERSGVDTVYTMTSFEPFLESVLSGRPWPEEGAQRSGAARSPHFDVFIGALEAGEAKLAIVLDQAARLGAPAPPMLAWANQLRDTYPGVSVMNAAKMVHALRQAKSPYERTLLERSAVVSSEAHMAGMKAARPGAAEYEVKAAIEAVYRARGALSPGYPSITGSGPNATILHYSKADRRMDSGDLMLVDAAANTEYYTIDITRTYPVSGKFSEAQKDIYRIVLQANEEAMKVARPGMRTRDVHQKTVDVIKEGLLKLGLITDANSEQWRTWYTHGSVHYIGIDVHDVGDQEVPLAVGHAFTIEPGVYIREDALEALPKTKENAAFIEKVKPVVEKYRGIGIRVEDSFVITETGLERLSKVVPRTIEEIEEFMAKR